jgi:hypothetical protein
MFYHEAFLATPASARSTAVSLAQDIALSPLCAAFLEFLSVRARTEGFFRILAGLVQLRPEGDAAAVLGSLCNLETEPDLATLYAFEFMRTEAIPLLANDDLFPFIESLPGLIETPATVPFWIGCRRFRLLVQRGVCFDVALCTFLAHNAHHCDTDDVMVALLAVLSKQPEWLADFGDPFLGPLFKVWLDGEPFGDDRASASGDVVCWLYCHGALPADHFGGLWVAHLTGEAIAVVPGMAARLIGARVAGIERLLCLSLPLLRPSLEAGQVLAYEDILGISFFVTWSFPAELAALDDFPEMVGFIWDYFESPEAVGGEASDFYLLAGTVAALADARVLPIGLDELRARALAWIAEADPAADFAAILAGVFVLLVCRRSEPAALAADFWVTEKLAGIVEAAPAGAEAFVLIGIAFALLLARFCPEQGVGLLGLAAGLSEWWKSCRIERAEQNQYLNWIPPVIADMTRIPEELRAGPPSE